MNTATLQPAPGSPIRLIEPSGSLAVGPQTGRYYVGGINNLYVVDPASGGQVRGLPSPLQGVALAATAGDETSVYTMHLVDPDNGLQFGLARIDTATLALRVERPCDLFDFPLAPVNGMALSPDAGTLFVVAPSLSMFKDKQIITRLLAYDAATLVEHAWSPVSLGTPQPIDAVMSPDGSRLFVLAIEDPTSTALPTYLHAVDPQLG